MTTEGEKFTLKATLLSNLLYKGRFHVPWHQRYYDWEKEHVEELLQDIDEARKEKRNRYFLGTVMLIKRKNKMWEINDGQQRIVTFSLICAFLCHLSQRVGDTRREVLAIRIPFNLDENHMEPLSKADALPSRLESPQKDKRNYICIIRYNKTIDKDSKLTVAWQTIKAFFQGMPDEKALDFLDFMLRKVEVAALHVPSNENSNAIYETLNCRGKSLSEFDMLRNHFYSFYNGDEGQPFLDEVHGDLERTIAAYKNSAEASKYARCYFQCQFGHLPEKRFYRETRRYIKKEIEADPSRGAAAYVRSLVHGFSLDDRIDAFRTILTPRSNGVLIANLSKDAGRILDEHPRNLLILLRELKSYGVVRPVIFALLNLYNTCKQENDKSETKKLASIILNRIDMLASLIMRMALILPIEPSHYDKDLACLAHRVMSAKSLDNISFEGALRKIDKKDNVLDDENFIAKASQVRIKGRKAKRFLLSLTCFKEPKNLMIKEPPCTLEHILPKSSDHLCGWEKFDPTEHESCKHRLGNLVLLGSIETESGKKENQSFAHKKNVYNKSPFYITKEVAQLDVDEWSPKTISDRQQKLAKLAARVWAFPKQKHS